MRIIQNDFLPLQADAEQKADIKKVEEGFIRLLTEVVYVVGASDDFRKEAMQKLLEAKFLLVHGITH